MAVYIVAGMAKLRRPPTLLCTLRPPVSKISTVIQPQRVNGLMEFRASDLSLCGASVGQITI
jgi:hypothetical protein